MAGMTKEECMNHPDLDIYQCFICRKGFIKSEIGVFVEGRKACITCEDCGKGHDWQILGKSNDENNRVLENSLAIGN